MGMRADSAMIASPGKPAMTPAARSGRSGPLGITVLSIRSPCQKPPFRKSGSSPIISMSSPRDVVLVARARIHVRVMSVRRGARIRCAHPPARRPAGPGAGSRAHRHHAVHRPAAAGSLLRRAAQGASRARSTGRRRSWARSRTCRERASASMASQSFLSAFLADANVKLVSCDTHVDHVQLLRFRPAMGHVRSEPLAAPRFGS